MYLFALAATEGGESNKFVDFMLREVDLGAGFKPACWVLLLAIVVLAALIVVISIVASRLVKKGKRVYAPKDETIDVSGSETAASSDEGVEGSEAEEETLAAAEDSVATTDYISTAQYEPESKPEKEEKQEEIFTVKTAESEKEEVTEEQAEAVEEEPVKEEEKEEAVADEVKAEPDTKEEEEEVKAEEPVKEEIKEETVAPVIAEEKPVAEEKQEEEKPVRKAAPKTQNAVAAKKPAVKKQTAKPVAAKQEEKAEDNQPVRSTFNPLEKPGIVLSSNDKVNFDHKEEKQPGGNMENKITGKFEICNSDLGGYNYLLLANNGQLLYESKSYKSVESCREAIENFIDAVKAGRFTIRADKFRNYKFILKSPTSNTLLYIGESFSTESSCKNNIESVKRFAPVSQIIDRTEEDFVAKFVQYEIPKEVIKSVKEGSGAVGKWEITRIDETSKNSPYVFLLFANNGQLLYESRDYKTPSSCLNGLKTFVNTVETGYFVIDPDKSGRYKFVLRSKSANSSMEYYGQNYDTQRACANSIDSVYHFALRSPIPGN